MPLNSQRNHPESSARLQADFPNLAASQFGNLRSARYLIHFCWRLLLLFAFVGGAFADPMTSARRAKEAERVEQSTALFARQIPILRLRIDTSALDHLRKEPRTYVEGVIEEAGGNTLEHVAIKLKGSVGSFQPIDAKPGFSINTSKFKSGSRFHGLKHFQLNNSVQDTTAMSELVAGEMARAAGVPASRCTHAIVTLNDRELGIYVLKEGMTEDFLSAFFKRTDGNLYEGGSCSEINAKMELHSGDDAHREGLLKLVSAFTAPRAAMQVELVSSLIDVDAYLRYLALENIMCHWDGYSYNRNNYRIYENPETGRFHFILHGMDQMFGDLRRPVRREPMGQVGAILWRSPEIRERYMVQLTDVYEKVLKPIDWSARIQEHGRHLLAALKPEQAKQYGPNITNVCNHVAERLKQVGLQIKKPSVMNAPVVKGIAEIKVDDWSPQVVNAESKELQEDGRACLYLLAKGEADASWRLSVTVPPGKFRFQARIKTRGVDAMTVETGEGAGLRVSGSSRAGQKALKGNSAWEIISYDIISPGRNYMLIAELRARSGEMWIDRESLRVVPLP